MHPAIDPQVLQKAKKIRIAVFDVDGVMTDGRLYLDDDGRELKAFYSRDGLGLKGLMRNGIAVAALTARTSRLVETRMAELGIGNLTQGREDKGQAFAEMLDRLGYERAQACYAGDDLVDWPALRDCGLSCTPADADPWLRARVDHVTRAPGGRGAVREICELLLEARGRLESWRDSY